ncbi:S-layer homology domain-containing protein [Paenibacillus sp. P25]|nr:S-layer homology domain-containing protein [Paenibacillus sp. P25]
MPTALRTARIRRSESAGTPQIKAIAAGNYYALALAADGTVWAWGDNSGGQLGDGTLSPRRTPINIASLNGIQAIAAGRGHSLALKNDGTVWAWGYNAFGQLGDGSTTNRTAPGQVMNMPQVTAIAAGSFHSLAVKSDGTVWAWGYNIFNQLGDGTTDNRNKPVQVQGLSGIASVSAGSYHSAALSSDNTVWTWGSNLSGQMGDGGFKNRAVPAVVTGFLPPLTDLEGHWAKSLITAAVEKGYVDGYEDGSFRPDNPITRAEIAKLAASALKLKTAAPAAGDPWYKPYAQALADAGMYGQADLASDWNAPATRGDIAMLAVRATSKELQGPNVTVDSAYAMQTAVKKGILQGLSGGRLAPEETTTRAQAVTIIERILSVNAGAQLQPDPEALKQLGS